RRHRNVSGRALVLVTLQLHGVVARLGIDVDLPGRGERALAGAVDGDRQVAVGVAGLDHDGVAVHRAADDQGVALHFGRRNDDGPGGRGTLAAVLVRGG